MTASLIGLLIQLHTPPLPATHVEPATGLHTNQDSLLESLTGRVESWRGGHRDGELLFAGGFRHRPVPQSDP